MTVLSNAHSGRYSVIDGIFSLAAWSINHNHTLAVASNSGTKNASLRRGGIHSWNGQYNAHGGLPIVFPGQSFTFEGYTAPDDDVRGNAGNKYTGEAMVSSVAITWNKESGQVLEHTVGFEGDGELTSVTGGYTPEDVADISNPEPICPTKIETSADFTTFAELDDWTQATLTMTNAVQPVVNSSTDCWTERTPGNFDANLTIGVQNTLLGAGLNIGDPYWIKMYTTATLFWSLKWMRLKEATGLQCNRQTGAIIAQTLPFEHSAVELVSTTPTIGFIKTPQSSPATIWP